MAMGRNKLAKLRGLFATASRRCSVPLLLVSARGERPCARTRAWELRAGC